ncbi:MAG: GNAT family N-acetyltransferase, partial [Bacteroidales bacterium]
TVEEMTLLQSRFPDNIRLFLAMEDQIPLAGALIYDTGQVIRIQYGHASQRGKELGALDLVYDHLIRFFSGNRNYLDFGQCTEQNGQFLNAGLIHQKESFGGRGTLYDIYQIDLLK